jgi:PAS domain S-box-containing protein
LNIEIFRTHFATFAAPMAVATPAGKLLEANEAYCRLIGYSRDELLNLPIFEYTHPDDLDNAKHLFQQVREGKITQFQYEKRYIRKDGAIVWAIVTTC